MKNIIFGFLIILLGILLLLDNLNILDFYNVIFTYWPVLLIVIGIYYLLKNYKIAEKHTETSPDLVQYSSVFNDFKLEINSKNFKGGTISTVFGDIILDISQAEIADGKHILKLNSVIGDLIVKVPENYNIGFKSSTLIGSLKIFDKSSNGLLKSLYLEKNLSPNLNKKFYVITSQLIGDLKIN